MEENLGNTEKALNPYDLDSTNFDSEKYLEKLLKNYSLKQIMDVESVVIRDTQSLHSEMQTLVYENYNKFISATDTIRKMKSDFKKMENDTNLLKDKMVTITTFSDQITDTLEGTRSQLCKLSEKHSLLKRLQFLSSLPAKLRQLIDESNYNQAVQDYLHAQKVLEQYGDQPSFKGIANESEAIITELKKKLKKDFEIGNTAQTLSDTGELLLQLNENPVELADNMLKCASKRLFEQTVMLQDQTERDMIEFIDLSIEGFLNDLTLVITSYFDMFLTKESYIVNYDLPTSELDKFVDKNLQKYLTLVKDRVDTDIGMGDTQIMLRGLDRLHRRLLAMHNICSGVEINQTAMGVIIGAAQQLSEVHSKLLKDNFSDSLSSIRLAVAKSDSNNSLNLNELISNLYISTIEKVKSVLQDLIIFLHSDWSFNIRADANGKLFIEKIRENLLIEFLKHICKTMNSFAQLHFASPPNLLLILSKTCLEMENNGVHLLITLVDDLYEIDSENSAELTHETELIAEMRDAAQNLLDSFVRLQGVNISHMLRKSVESRDWLNCLEPRSVRAVMKRIVEELSAIEKTVGELYETGGGKTAASSDSSRKTHFSNLTASKQQFRSNWSNYTQSQIDSSYASNIHRLFSERIEIFTSVEFTKVSIITGIIKIGLKTFLESVRLKTFSKFGLQQIQVDTHYLQQNLWRFVADENVINFLLDEILGSAVQRCLDSILMEPNVVDIICERG